ncbi:MAG: hypothetical protein NWE93_07120 [Candidatus Bathyarchaeota archaeon]|nr:hypothetical protein [Candidatus Bathyarchaeota archaeon]
MNTKMLMAPVLAITLALLLAGAISMIVPQEQADVFTTGSENYGANPIPTPRVGASVPTAAPQPMASAADLYSLPAFLMFAAAAVIVGVAVVLLFFREKNLDKN